MLRIGLTGGIGSGKTTVAKIFETLGIPVYYADTAAKRLMNEDAALKEHIRRAFGDAAYENGLLNRTYLGSVVFTDEKKIALLNSLVHPAVFADTAAWMQLQTAPYCLKEAALIFESGSQQGLDKVIGVYAPAALRIQRAMQRDNISREKIIARMDNQVDELMKMKLCDYVLVNDEQQLLIPQVLELDRKLRALAAEV